MVGIFRRYFRHRAIKKYMGVLGFQLQKQYGTQKYFTQGQIRVSLEKLRLGGSYASYAYGLYIDPEELGEILQSLKVSESVESVRNFLSDNYLNGRRDYSFANIKRSTIFRSHCNASGSSDPFDSVGDGGDGGGGD